MSDSSPEIKQPIHPSLIEKLDKQYLELHSKYVAHLTPPHTLPWDPAIRNAAAVPGGAHPLPVGKVLDFDVASARVRTYTPDSEAPVGGWPVLLYFHGGGWTLGNLSSESSFCTNMCNRSQSVVVSVDYRLAPENPYPAAVQDAVDSLIWVYRQGPVSLNVNPSRIAVGGASSGGNLAAILAIKAKYLEDPIPLIFQLLIVPVTDNTASVENRWAENQHAPWLSPGRMIWFKENYLPNEEDWKKWDASPIFATQEMLEGLPPAFIAVAELDILSEEGIAYGEKLKAAGVEVEVEVYKGAPHPVMAMDGELNLLSWRPLRFLLLTIDLELFDTGILDIGKKLVSDSASALERAFGSVLG